MSFSCFLTTILVVVSTSLASIKVIPGHSEENNGLSIVTSVDPEQITVGDLFLYQIIVTSPGDAAVEWPKSGIPPVGFDLVSFEHVGPIMRANGKNVDSLRYELTLYRTGKHSIPPFSLSGILSDGTKLSAISDSIAITVTSVLDDNANDIRDLKSPVEIPDDIPWYWWVIGGLVLLAVTLGVIFCIKRRRGRNVTRASEMEIKKSVEEIVLEELEQLACKECFAQGLVKFHYSELSEILRRYLSARYQIAAMEYTTTELINSLNVLKLGHEKIRIIRELFEECDIVKFARFVPESHRQNLSVQEAREIVEFTRLPAGEKVSAANELPAEENSLAPNQDS